MRTPGTAEGNAPLLEVFSEKRSFLIGLATRITGCRSHAEDIVHDAYLKLDSGSLSSTIKCHASYLVGVVRNLAIDHSRRRSREQRLICDEDDCATSGLVDSAAPEQQVADRQELERIANALAELPERTRYAFEMCRVHGMKQKDIAERLGVSPALVNALIRDALIHCRRTLRD
ncbi:putative RNA polymerase sigma factor FecI [compost metagenome]